MGGRDSFSKLFSSFTLLMFSFIISLRVVLYYFGVFKMFVLLFYDWCTFGLRYK